MYRKTVQSFIIISLLILAACSKSEEDISHETLDQVKDIFFQTERILDEKNNSITYYIPKGLEIEEVDEHNIVLEGKNQAYVIFKNPLESPTSDRLYHLAKIDEAMLYESFESEDMFAYIRIRPDYDQEPELYELQIGVGGVKVTTNVKLKEIPKEAEKLMKIAKSIVEDIFEL